jgi:uncharacterized protein YbbK (DUF523 family)
VVEWKHQQKRKNEGKVMKLISACLLGIKCAWSGDDRYENERAAALAQKEELIPVCPEQLGGLPTPRAPQEIQGGTGEDVLDGRCRIININGQDVTEEFIKGAEETLKLAVRSGVTEFIGKSASPSCGCYAVYDGTFSGRLIKGSGVTAALLQRSGIKLISEQDL